MLSIKSLLRYFSISFTVVCFMYACANIGQGPQGGAYDFNPPVLVKSTPINNQTNFTEQKINLYFDENVVLKEASQKVIVTPPQKRMPIISSANKKVTIILRDSLQVNTTYVVDFTDAIQDNNQNNPLENFSIAFSTGETIDSLAVSGRVYTAKDDEPVKGYYVGLHSNLSDTAFTNIPFERISRTNDQGFFTIRGVAPGKYHIFALEDKNRDYMYDNLDEAIAFSDVLIEPTVQEANRFDTIYNKTNPTVVDSIVDVKYTRYLPDDIILQAFVSGKKRQYFRNALRSDAHRFELNFGSETQEPLLEPLNFEVSGDWAIKERNLVNDSIYMYWLIDRNIIEQDSLLFKFTYQKTDSLNMVQTFTDSLYVINRARKVVKKDKNKEKKKKIKENEEEEEVIFLDFKHNLTASFNIYDTIQLEFGEPLQDDLQALISLQHKPELDSIYYAVDFGVVQDSLNPRKYRIKYKWDYGQSYKISMDSATVYSVYGYYADKWEQQFKIKPKEDYANLVFNVSGISDEYPLFMQLLDSSGKVVKQSKVRKNTATFRNILPGKYFALIVVDRNDNNKWDTGDYFENKQPESVYYFPKEIELRAYWDAEENFHVDTLSFAKPKELLKNKPKEKSEREKLLEEQDAKQYEQEKERKKQENLATGRNSRSF